MSKISRRIALTSFGVLCCGYVMGAAFIVTSPYAVRQSYRDGSFSEIVCDVQTPKQDRCQFRTGHKKVEHTYSLSLSQYGYHALSPSLDYSYFDNHISPPSIKMGVSCINEDYRLVPKANKERDYVSCTIGLLAYRGRMIAQTVEVSATVDGESFFETRPVKDDEYIQ